MTEKVSVTPSQCDSRIEEAKEIIAVGCGCDRHCEQLVGADVYCGCEEDARKVLALATPPASEPSEAEISAWCKAMLPLIVQMPDRLQRETVREVIRKARMSLTSAQ